jgi:hypothetical protein
MRVALEGWVGGAKYGYHVKTPTERRSANCRPWQPYSLVLEGRIDKFCLGATFVWQAAIWLANFSVDSLVVKRHETASKSREQ